MKNTPPSRSELVALWITSLATLIILAIVFAKTMRMAAEIDQLTIVQNEQLITDRALVKEVFGAE